MIENYNPTGKNLFKNNRFGHREWSAPYLKSYQEIKEQMDSFNLVGRTITDIRAIGISYMHSIDYIEEEAYCRLEKMGKPEEEIYNGSCYDDIDEDLPFYRYMEIDEPIMFKLDNGDRFEILIGVEPIHRVSINTIPWEIEAGVNHSNVSAAILFSPCIGTQIVDIEYKTDFEREINDSLTEIVTELIIWLSNGMGLRFESIFHDYCDVYLIDENKELVTMPFSELKKARLDE